jgi:hypothetical protein
LSYLVSFPAVLPSFVHSIGFGNHYDARSESGNRARITQIMNLLCLSPKMQEELLFVTHDDLSTRVRLRHLQSVVVISNWRPQQATWQISQ